MSRPLTAVFKQEHREEISNHSDNRAFSQVVSASFRDVAFYRWVWLPAPP